MSLIQYSPATTLVGLLLAAVSWLPCGSTAFAHEEGHDEPVESYPAKLQFQPTPLPDRVVLTWSGDATKSIDLSWRTDSTVARSLAEFARSGQLVGNMKGGVVPHATRVEGSTEDFASDLGACHVHSIHLADLAPATMYVYRVGDGTN